MPASKQTYLRYHIINACLRSRGKRYWSLTELVCKLEERDILVCGRTVERDFEAMRYDSRLGFDSPIKYCSLNKGYYYADKEYSIDQLNLTEEAIETLQLAAEIIRPYRGISLLEGFSALVARIVGVRDVVLNRAGAQFPDIYWCNSFPDKIIHYANLLLQAIRKKSVVHMTTEDAAGRRKEEFYFHPYHIEEYQHEWYVVGLSESDDSYTFKELKNIESVELSVKPFRPFKPL